MLKPTFQHRAVETEVCWFGFCVQPSFLLESQTASIYHPGHCVTLKLVFLFSFTISLHSVEQFEPILISCFSSSASWHVKVLIEMQDEDFGLKSSPG